MYIYIYTFFFEVAKIVDNIIYIWVSGKIVVAFTDDGNSKKKSSKQ